MVRSSVVVIERSSLPCLAPTIPWGHGEVTYRSQICPAPLFVRQLVWGPATVHCPNRLSWLGLRILRLKYAILTVDMAVNVASFMQSSSSILRALGRRL